MTSISTFKAFPQLPALGVSRGLKLELNKLVDPTHYPPEFLHDIAASEWAGHYNSAHGPFYDLVPASSDPEIRSLCRQKLTRAIHACRELHIPNIVFHTGWMKDFYPDTVWIDNSIAFWGSLLSECGNEVSLHLENVFEPKVHLVKEIIRGIGSPSLRACIDIGHLNLTAPGDIEHWLEELGELTGHLHIHNNFGTSDDHNGLDRGTIDIKRILARTGDTCPNATKNLEIKNNFEVSIDMMQEFA